MSLNPARFERYNGHPPTVSYDRTTGEYRATCECTCDRGATILEGLSLRSESQALERLLAKVLEEHGRICMDRAGWKCQECGSVLGLSPHHKVFKSHGRDDRITNLIALDLECHERKHGLGNHSNIHRVDKA